jgi:transcriptional regulator with XRE-family HTH domain
MKIEKNSRWQRMVGNRLQLTRIALGKSQAELARVLLISPQRWNNYERGARPIDIEFAIRLCERFSLTLDWLYRGQMGGLPFELAQRLGSIEGGEHPLKN